MKKLALLSAFIVFAHNAQAEERACCYDKSSWYGAIGVMGVLPNEVTVDEEPQLGPPIGYDHNLSFGITAVGGYQLFPNASFEVEYVGQFQDTDNPRNITFTSGQGHKHNSIMFNHRWIYRNLGSIAPYLGAGAGMMIADHGDRTLNDSINPAETQELKDALFAYQFMGGLNFAPPGSKMEFYLGYRYIGAQQLETRFNVAYGGVTFKEDVNSHNIELGVRMHF